MDRFITDKRSKKHKKTMDVEGVIKIESKVDLFIDFGEKTEWIPKSLIRSRYISSTEVKQVFEIDTWILKKYRIGDKFKPPEPIEIEGKIELNGSREVKINFGFKRVWIPKSSIRNSYSQTREKQVFKIEKEVLKKSGITQGLAEYEQYLRPIRERAKEIEAKIKEKRLIAKREFKFRNRIFGLSCYDDPYDPDDEDRQPCDDEDIVVSEVRDKESAMILFIETYFSEILEPKDSFWDYIWVPIIEELIWYTVKFIESENEEITADILKDYLKKDWEPEIYIPDHIRDRKISTFVSIFEQLWDSQTETITKEQFLDYSSKIYSELEDNIHLWESIEIKYEFGEKLIQDAEDILGIDRDLLTIEKIKSYLVTNAEQLIHIISPHQKKMEEEPKFSEKLYEIHERKKAKGDKFTGIDSYFDKG